MFHCSKLQENYILKQRTDSRSVEDYFRECEKESDYILSKLGNMKPARVLDIGCGMGGIAALMSDSLGSTYYLFDKNDNGFDTLPNPYGFSAEPRYYNNIELLQQFVTINRPEMKTFITDDINNIESEIGLIISTYSMGWHYPIEEYLDKILQIHQSGGLMIIDIRTWNEYNRYIHQILVKDYIVLETDEIQPGKGYRYILKRK